MDSLEAVYYVGRTIGMSDEEINSLAESSTSQDTVGVSEFVRKTAEGHDRKSVLVGAMLLYVTMKKVV